ncbi:MAG: AbgT family transporter [Erysipelotrichaceae bacterium]|nr:AbgT family transporter [Erysipelotrichaceae bacterium]
MENKQIKSFKVATITIGLIMLMVYIATLFIEGCHLSISKFLLSPLLVLGANGSATIIAVIIFLLIIGGVTNTLNECGFIEYLLNKLVGIYGDQKYKLMYVLVFFFMALGSLIGSFEEVVPLVPLVVALSMKLGFDECLGVGMSLLAVGCGFAAGVFNPFTIGVAQSLANLPMFSGVSLRLLSFILIYLLLTAFLRYKAKGCEKDMHHLDLLFGVDPNKDRAILTFGTILIIGFICVLSSPFIKVLQDYTMIIIALCFLIGGSMASFISGLDLKTFGKSFLKGVIDVAPSILLILMASSIRFLMEESGMINIVLDKATSIAGNLNNVGLILFIYLLCLILEIFVPSGSAKAFLLIPIITPLAAKFGISSQLCILAYAFGDGFSNVLYPTNPALLISLGLIQMDYKKWFKWSVSFQLLNLLLTSSILLLGLFIGY